MSFKIISLFVFLVICQNAWSQKYYQMDLYTLIVKKDTSECRYQRVIWGGDKDVLCIGLSYDQSTKCFHRTETGEDGYILTKESKTMERYAVNLSIREDGFFMVVQNLDKGFPHYFMSTKDICEATRKVKTYQTQYTPKQ